jgi:hypothetical protein
MMLLAACLALQACLPTAVPRGVTDNKSITLIAVEEPAGYLLTSHQAGAAVPGGDIPGVPSSGVLGYLLNQPSRDPGDPAFTESLKSTHFHFGAELTKAVADALKNDGYAVDLTHAAGRSGNEPFATMPPDMPGSGPILDMVVTEPGYMDKPFGRFYPVFALSLRLFDRSTGKAVFSRDYSYNEIVADSAYGIRSQDELLANPGFAVDGFRAGISYVAENVGHAFAR